MQKTIETYQPSLNPEKIREFYEQVGEELGLDGRCSVGGFSTYVTFEETETGYQHTFVFATDPAVFNDYMQEAGE